MISKIFNIFLGKRNVNANNTLSIPNSLDLDYTKFKTVFDLGAYHGSFIEAILIKNPAIEIHAFEPNTLAFNIIKEKFPQKNIFLNNTAVGEVLGERSFFINNFEETNSLLESNLIDANLDDLTKNINIQKVSVTTLDNYTTKAGIKNIDLIKVDTQGNSYNVLLGAFNLLKRKAINYIFIEAEFIEIYKNEKCFSEIELFLRQLGYQLVNFYNLNYTTNNRIAWCDCLFTINEKDNLFSQVDF